MERIEKYFDKGFDIIMPNLNIKKIPSRNFKFDHSEILDLPFLHVSVREISSNKIYIDYITIPKELDSTPVNAYDQANLRNRGQIIHDNICCLIHEKTDEFCCYGEDENFPLAFRKYPLITERMIVNSYLTVKSKVFEEGKLDFNVMEKYFSIKPVSEILNESLMQIVKNKESLKEHFIFDSSFKKAMEEYWENLIDTQVAEARKMVMNLERTLDATDYELSANTEEKEKCSVSEWYGAYYLEI